MENSNTLRKAVTHIDCPKEWESTNDYDSHRPLLYLAVTKMKHPIIEFGCGFGSTPLLKKYCEEIDSIFVSLETDKEWAGKFPGTFIITNYKNWNGIKPSLLFIDSKPGEERKELIKQYTSHAWVIVAHDTEPGAEYVYGMSEVLNSFKHRLDYQPEGKPHTTAVSNFIDITQWINQY